MNNNMSIYDIIVIGAGVIGVNVALHFKKRFPNLKIALLEKENQPALHTSGRNSGVIHAGFYYSEDSFKAKFTSEGNTLLKKYCAERNIRVLDCGKLVIAKDEADLNQFSVLLSRAKKNNVQLFEISKKEALELEPLIKTYEKALWSPATATVDPIEVMKSLILDAKRMGIHIYYQTKFLNYNEKNNSIKTSQGSFTSSYFINTSGLYADQVAKKFGFSKKYRILPFKGIYLYANSRPAQKLNRHIYPVPNLSNPFLGVHHTITMSGDSKIGPTAIPAFWREQYQYFDNFSLTELISILKDQFGLIFNANFDFKGLAMREIRKYSKNVLISEALSMVNGYSHSDYIKWGKPGVRAQLFNTVEKKLVMDFILEGNKRSFHVLNAISPAFTCSIPFSNYIMNEIIKLGTF